MAVRQQPVCPSGFAGAVLLAPLHLLYIHRGTGVPTDVGNILSAGGVAAALGGTGKGKKRCGRAAIVACGEAAEEFHNFAPRRQALTMPSPRIMVDADRIVSLTYGSCSPVFCAKIVDRIYFYLIIYVRSNLCGHPQPPCPYGCPAATRMSVRFCGRRTTGAPTPTLYPYMKCLRYTPR